MTGDTQFLVAPTEAPVAPRVNNKLLLDVTLSESNLLFTSSVSFDIFNTHGVYPTRSTIIHIGVKFKPILTVNQLVNFD